MRSNTYIPRTTDRRITIERGTPSRNTSGGEVLTWATLSTRYAAVSYATGGENTTSNKETASQVVIFKCRYVSGLTEKDRIVYNSIPYDITQIVELGRRHFHSITTEYRQ